jgi:formate hydrogenlyase transcriptional activator
MASKREGGLRGAERLAALRRTSLLDSAPEEAFDRLTRLSSIILGAPVAIVSLLDGERIFIKSSVGLPEPLATSRETPVAHSFCRLAVESGETCRVADGRQDPRVKDSPLVIELGLIAYAGVPLSTKDGFNLGTLCVLDRTPRAWTAHEMEVLHTLAASVMTEIGTRSLASELKALNENLQGMVDTRTAELNRAQERWQVLLRVNNAIVTCLDRDGLLRATAAALRDVIPFDRAALVLHDEAKGVFQLLGVSGHARPDSAIPIGTEWPIKGSRAGWVTEHAAPLATPDLRADARFVEHGPLIQEGILSALSVPLQAKDRIIGTLNVGSREVSRYTDGDAELLHAIADQVVLAIQNMLAYEEIAALKHRLEQENLYLQEEARADATFAEVVGESTGIQKVLARVRMVAGTESTVLVTGETGTGKELVVRALHGLSRRKDNILVKVNCAALPGGVIESELFGHERGAFTGALSRRPGRFELAHGGTLLLDEVGDLPLELQAKLLRVLQDGEFERVGGTQTLKTNVRVIAATNRNLTLAVEEGRFRADLFYRLNVFPIAIPPLRERLEDVPRLARHFAMLYASRMGKRIGAIGEEELSRLLEYPWPGNVRELQNVIERAVILSASGRFVLDDALAAPGSAALAAVGSVSGNGPARTDPAHSGPADTGAPRTLEEIERDHILAVLESVGWRVSGDQGAARILGLKRTTLEARMSRLGISRPGSARRPLATG